MLCEKIRTKIYFHKIYLTRLLICCSEDPYEGPPGDTYCVLICEGGGSINNITRLSRKHGRPLCFFNSLY